MIDKKYFYIFAVSYTLLAFWLGYQLSVTEDRLRQAEKTIQEKEQIILERDKEIMERDKEIKEQSEIIGDMIDNNGFPNHSKIPNNKKVNF